MPFDRFLPHQAWTAQTAHTAQTTQTAQTTHTAQTAQTPPSLPRTVGSTAKLHFNRLLDVSPPHQPMAVRHASQFRHKAHEADDIAKQYQKTNQSIRQQIEKAKLVHGHLHTTLLHRIQHRADICSVTLRELCTEKMMKHTRFE